MAHQINLLDPELIPGRKPFSAVTMALSLVLLAAGAAGVYAIADFEARRLKPLVAMAERQTAERRAELLRLSQTAGERVPSKVLDDEIGRLEARTAARRALLADLKGRPGASQGFSSYLSALARQRRDDVWLTRIGVAALSGDVSLEGRALDARAVPAYLGLLRDETAFSGRSVSELKVSARELPAAPSPADAAGKAAPVPPAAALPARYVEFAVTLARASDADAAPAGSGQ